MLHVLTRPDFERADRIGEFWGYPESRAADRLRGPGGARRDAAGRRQVGGEARTSDLGFRFLLELSDLDRHSECTGDIARS